MFINYGNIYSNINLTSQNTKEKIPTISSIDFESKSNKLFLKTKNNSRNNNPIFLHKNLKDYNLFIHTLNNNKKNDINFINSIKNGNIKKGISYTNIKYKLNNNKNQIDDLTQNNRYTETLSNKSIDFYPNEENKFLYTDSNYYNNIKKTKISHSLSSKLFNQKKNKIYRNNNINLYELPGTVKKEFNKRNTISHIPNIQNKYNYKKSLSHSYSNNINKGKSINCLISNPNLKDKISQLIKEISNNHKGEIKYYEKGEDLPTKKKGRIKFKKNNKNKTINSMAKNNRNKFFNLLNKDGSLNSFLKTMKYKNTNNIFKNYTPKENKIFKRPKNTLEMNRLLFNSFALNKGGSNEFSKKLYSLNETFFTIMNEMKIAKAEMEIENLNNNNVNNPMNIEAIKKREKKWEKKFLLNMYKNKLSEKEFKKFKKMNKIQQKKEIMKDSRQLADNIMKMDAHEYEIPDDINEFRSTRSFVSNINVYRIRRVKRIMKNIEDKEQLGAYDVNVEKLKKNQKKSETEAMLAIKRSGKPRFVKTQFKPSTISKYKEISGEYFGLPA